jgi:hypothetical protein
MARQRLTVVLVPSEAIDFSSGPSSIAYHNLSSRQAVAFRVMFTSPDLLTAAPAEGMVPPGKHVEIILTPMDSSESSRLPHRVIVRSLAVPSQQRAAETAPMQSGQLSPMSQLWASAGAAGADGVEEHLLSCVRNRAPTESATASASSAARDVRLLAQRESSAEARLAACERLLLLRTSQLAAAEHTLVAERNAATVTCEASTSASASSAAATTAAAATAAAAAGAAAATAPSTGSVTGEPPSPHAAATSLRRPPRSYHRPRCAPLVSHLFVGLLGVALGLAFYHPLYSLAWELVPRSCRSPSSQELELCWVGGDQRDPRLDQGAGFSAHTAARAKARRWAWGRFGLGTRAPWAARADAAGGGDSPEASSGTVPISKAFVSSFS